MAISDDELEALRAVKEGYEEHNGRAENQLLDDPVDNPPTNSDRAPWSVSKKMCEDMRDYLEDHSYRETAEEFGVAKGVAELHSEGGWRECSHKGLAVDPSRCAVMREMARDGWSDRELAARFGYSHAVPNTHITGACSHDIRVPPVRNREDPQRKVSDTLCDEMRGRYPDDSTPDMADDLDISTSTVRSHIIGDCGCDNDVGPVEMESR